jgi:hypothetical protein
LYAERVTSCAGTSELIEVHAALSHASVSGPGSLRPMENVPAGIALLSQQERPPAHTGPSAQEGGDAVATQVMPLQ